MINKISFGICCFLLFSGPCFAEKVNYQDSKDIETVTIDFGSTDLLMITEKMVSSLLMEDELLTNKPIIKLGYIKNKTSEYIDTNNILSSISTYLTKSKKVRIAASNDDNQQIVDELAQQNQNGLYKKSTAPKIGNMLGAKYLLDGELTSIVKKNSSEKDVYYKFTLKLRDLEQNIIEWQEEKDIRKTAKR